MHPSHIIGLVAEPVVTPLIGADRVTHHQAFDVSYIHAAIAGCIFKDLCFQAIARNRFR